MGELLFVTGGARSGKSRFAERLAAALERPVVYIATMEPLDAELRERVAHHQAGRPEAWRTVEAPLDPVAALRSADPEACALLDCLSLWVANRLLVLDEEPGVEDMAVLERALESEVDALAACAHERTAPTILVTNEVGAGVVPDNALARAYRDLLGRVNQRASAHADRAWLLVSGRALELPARE